jgi:hypothetical protein
MDEKEMDEPYCVLDIPHRFWTWVREYIGHVDEKFLRDFNDNFYERYQPEKMDEFFLNEPFKVSTAMSTQRNLQFLVQAPKTCQRISVAVAQTAKRSTFKWT